MMKENKKVKTPEQVATERLRKRVKTMIKKAGAFHKDCKYHVQFLLINETNPSRQFEFKTFEDPHYPPQDVKPEPLLQHFTKPDLDNLKLAPLRSSSPETPAALEQQSGTTSPSRCVERIDWERMEPPVLERSPVN
ncbi:hypothetical protein H2204_011717 [Knufia peltigerae]|uniref:Uncharacterized protein n=1 Tax=Knufia peltigerae TaxID=1002370 RepID=A0AA39CTM4_9EURO|nr:hypothetical protein H2204_011717 [Knufia peltigerae]